MLRTDNFITESCELLGGQVVKVPGSSHQVVTWWLLQLISSLREEMVSNKIV